MKRTVVQRLMVNVALQDLEPTPEFEKDVLDVLGKPSVTERFKRWIKYFSSGESMHLINHTQWMNKNL